VKKTITLDDSERRIYLFKTGSAELVDANPFEGIKLLGRGEFVVPPATIGDKKAACRFVAGRAPGEIRLAAAPEWLSPAFRSPTTEPLRAKAMEVRRIRIDDILVDEDDRRELDEAASKSSASGKPADTTIPPAAGRPATGVRKAPRHEIAAVGGAAAVPRALWGFASSRGSENGSVEPYSVSSGSPNHSIRKARKDARQSEKDRTTNGRTQGGCPIRCRIDASVDQTSPSGKHRHVKRDSSNRLGRVLCRR
jgi:hypothetical protein